MELLPLEFMLVIVLSVTMLKVFLTHVRAHKWTMLLPLLDTELKVENPIGWSRIPGEPTGEMVASSRLPEEIHNVVLDHNVHWWNVQRQELLHPPHKLHLRPLFLHLKYVTLAICMEPRASLDNTHWLQTVCILKSFKSTDSRDNLSNLTTTDCLFNYSFRASLL